MNVLPTTSLRAFALVLLALSFTPPLGAQTPPGSAEPTAGNGSPNGTDTSQADDIDARLAELRAAVAAERELLDVEADAPAQAVELIDVAGAALDEAEVARVQTAEFRRLTETANSRLAALSEQLQQPRDESLPPELAEPSLENLEQRASRSEAELAAAHARVADLEEEESLRRLRSSAIPEELARLSEQLVALEQDRAVASAATGGESERLSALRTLALSSRILAARARSELLEAEAASYDARAELLPRRVSEAKRQVARADLLATTWSNRASQRRQLEAARTVEEAERERREAAAASPTLGAIAARNVELAEARSGEDGLTAELDRQTRATRQLRELGAEVQRRFHATVRRVEVGGVTQGVGDLLRRDVQWLPNLASLRSEAATRRERLSRLQLREFELHDERDEVGDVGIRQQQVLAELEAELGAERAAELADVTLALLRGQENLLDRSIADLERLLAETIEQVRLHRVLREDVRTYRSFIDERILWYPSDTFESWIDGGAYVDAGVWLISPSTWSDFASSLLAGARQRTTLSVLALLLLLLWVVFARRLRRTIEDLGAKSRSFKTDRHAVTILASLAYFGVVLPIPAALWIVAGLAEADPAATTGTLAIGRAIDAMLVALLALVGLREAARVRGIGETIFRWRPARLAVVKRWVLRLGPAYIAFSALAVTLDAAGPDAWSGGPGRVAFVLSQLILFAGLRRGFRDLEGWAVERREAGGSRPVAVRRFWMVLALVVPLVLVVVSAAGYSYAAVEFGGYYRLSLVLGLLVILAHAIALRWLFVARRRLAVERAQARMQARVEAEKEGEIARELGALEESDIDLPAIDAQTRQFIRSLLVVATVMGLYGIWSAGLPAVAVLDRVEIWPRFGHIESEDDGIGLEVAASADATGADAGSEGLVTAKSTSPRAPLTSPLSLLGGGAATDTGSADASAVENPVSLADVFLFLLVVLLTTVGTKNVPGLLEITLLKRLPLDSGARTAIATLVRYVILIIGSSIAFTTLGIGWDKVQWLAAAFTFGLAFGLQEVFANFVSGVIILLERPIRVGDIVTVAGTEGRVTRLRMRATTIMDWDRKEMLVPNKEFITSSVINWSLSDPVSRQIINVGVAYGSDVKLVHEQLYAVAKANDLVLDDPAPQVVFTGFGASSLDFELRVFMATRDVWPELVDRMHSEIDAAFREHGIEISFPQRDLHIRSARGLEDIYPSSRGVADAPPPTEPDRTSSD